MKKFQSLFSTHFYIQNQKITPAPQSIDRESQDIPLYFTRASCPILRFKIPDKRTNIRSYSCH